MLTNRPSRDRINILLPFEILRRERNSERRANRHGTARQTSEKETLGATWTEKSGNPSASAISPLNKISQTGIVFKKILLLYGDVGVFVIIADIF